MDYITLLHPRYHVDKRLSLRYSAKNIPRTAIYSKKLTLQAHCSEMFWDFKAMTPLIDTEVSRT